MRRLVAAVALAVAGLAAAPVPAYAEMPPPPVGHFRDGPDALPPAAERTLENLLTNMERSLGRSVYVAVVRTTDNLAPDVFAERVYRSWVRVTPALRSGALVVVGTNRLVAAVHAGPDAADRLSQEDADRVERDSLRPRVARGEIVAGVSETVALLLQHLATAPVVLPSAGAFQDGTTVPPFGGVSGTQFSGFPKWLFAVPVLIFAGIVMLILRAVLGVGRTVANVADTISSGHSAGAWQNEQWVASRGSRAGDGFGARPGV